MLSSADCLVCRSTRDALTELETSWVLVGPDDPMRGYACLVFARHAIELHHLTDAEGAALMRDIGKVSAAITAIVQPIKMNHEGERLRAALRSVWQQREGER